MAQETRRKLIYYKRAVLTNTNTTIQTLLKQALKKVKFANQRREAYNQDNHDYRLVNHHTLYNGMLCGQLVIFSSGKNQSLITLDDKAQYYAIDKIAPPAKAGKRQEFLESILYFGILDNHVIIMPSKGLNARDLETHLSWLFGTCTTVLGGKSALILQDKPTEEAIKRIYKNPVKKVNIGSPIETRAEADETETDTESQGVKSVRWVPVGTGMDVLRTVLGDNWINKLNLEDSLDEANLHVNLEITYSRKTTKQGQKVIDNIASSLRHMEPDDVDIRLKDGSRIKGDDLKLSSAISVKTIDGLVDENDLYHQMHDWLVTQIYSEELLD